MELKFILKEIPTFVGMKKSFINEKPYDVALRHTCRRAFQTNQPKFL
tara:strand:- start:1144 stop:1284 length:141 start_codon:yes stop_codon:yes gene_type:complete